MIKVTLGEAKLGLSSYLELLQSGEVVIICRNGEPISELRAVAMPKQGEERHFGLWDGFGVSESFFEPLPDEILKAFYGE